MTKKRPGISPGITPGISLGISKRISKILEFSFEIWSKTKFGFSLKIGRKPNLVFDQISGPGSINHRRDRRRTSTRIVAGSIFGAQDLAR